jgi:hypothetical protein
MWTWSSAPDPAPAAPDAGGPGGPAAAPGGCLLPRDREVRLPARPRAEGPTAFVSVMEGCSKYCTYCVVPYTRGEEVSRPFDDVIAEVAGLAEQGVREVNLLGQNVNAYRGRMHDGETADLALADPLRGGHRRHRAHPLHHLHPVELQRLPDRGLRGGAGAGELPAPAGAERLGPHPGGHEAGPHGAGVQGPRSGPPAPGAPGHPDLVGLHRRLPGETETDFAATLALVDDIGFDQSFSFIYSRRPGTPAADYPTTSPWRSSRSAWPGCSSASRPSPALSRRMVGRGPAGAGGGPVPQGPAAARRAHREQPGGELPRRPGAWSAASSTSHHRGPAQLPARRLDGPRRRRPGLKPPTRLSRAPATRLSTHPQTLDLDPGPGGQRAPGEPVRPPGAAPAPDRAPPGDRDQQPRGSPSG